MSSVPPRFLKQLAELVSTSTEHLVRTLSLPPAPDPARSFRSDQKPIPSEAVSFEQVLIDAGAFLTALVLAGGADGIHKIVSGFRSFRS